MSINTNRTFGIITQRWEDVKMDEFSDIIGIKTKLKLHSLALGIILTSILGGLYYLNDRIDRKFEILDAKIGQMTILIDSKTDRLDTKFDHKLDSLADKIDQKFDLLINLIKTQK